MYGDYSALSSTQLKAYIAAGLTYGDIVQKTGVSKSTIYRMMVVYGLRDQYMKASANDNADQIRCCLNCVREKCVGVCEDVKKAAHGARVY